LNECSKLIDANHKLDSIILRPVSSLSQYNRVYCEPMFIGILLLLRSS